MASVELKFTALPAHVRTARLVAVAMARRAGVDDETLDEVRLAVGEACTRAVDLHERHCAQEPVLLTLRDDDDRFSVVVTDRAPATGDANGTDAATAVEANGTLPPGVGLAVITGLVDDVDVQTGATGGSVRMAWPLRAATPAS